MDMFIEFNYFPVSSGVDYNEKDKALLRRRINMMNVKINAKEVSLKKVQKDAEDSYRGGFFCCEAVMDAIRSNFEIDVPKEVIGMASAMSVGAGRSG